MTSQLPRSRAKDAYGLLSDIARIITEEPKRLAMAVWRTRDAAYTRRGLPACGTVGCIGGWTEVLTGNERTAESTLGLISPQSQELFYPRALTAAPNQQTAAHARATVAHIRRFQKKYAAQLKATKVDPR